MHRRIVAHLDRPERRQHPGRSGEARLWELADIGPWLESVALSEINRRHQRVTAQTDSAQT